MTIPVQDIFDRVTDLLLDKDRADDQARWTDDELIRWVNDSRMAILIRRPAACSKTVVHPLAQGSLQALPAGGVMLLDVVRNMGVNGTTPGRSIRRTDRQNIDDSDLYWHKGRSSVEISQFTYDDRAPKEFFVYPPATAGTQIQLVHAAIPAAVTDTDDDLDIGLEYIDAVINYVCYRAKSKDSEYANAAEAGAFFAAFNDVLGVTAQTQSTASPNQPGNSV
jgi:hypothetical protein